MLELQVKEELCRYLDRLPPDRQRDVLDFARSLAVRPVGFSGAELLAFAGTITPEDAAEMSKAIEEECNQVDPDGW